MQCKRKSTQKRTLNDNNVCIDCVNERDDNETNLLEIDDSKSISELTFGKFKKWMAAEFYDKIKTFLTIS